MGARTNGGLSPRSKAPANERTAPAEAPTAEFRQFLDELGTVSPGPDSGGEAPACLLYLLGADDAIAQRAELRLALARRTGAGRYTGAQRLADPGAAAAGQGIQLDMQDRRLLRALLLDADPTPEGTLGISPRMPAEMIERLVATGRCHWDNAEGHALSAGPRRRAELAWCIDEEGTQTIRITGDATVNAVIASTPLWYVDAEAGLAGPLEIGLPPASVLALLRAPPVPAMKARASRDAMAALAPGLPLPADIDEEAPARTTPRPRLTLYSDPYGGGMLGRTPGTRAMLHYALLEHDYGGLLAHADSPGILRGYAQGSIRQIPRDPRAERAAVERLRHEDMRTLSELGPNVIWPQRLAGAWSFASEEQWTRFMLRLPQLGAEGWQIRRDPGFLFEVEEASHWTARVRPADDGGFEVELGIDVGGEQINLLPLLPDIRRALIEGGRRETVLVRGTTGRMLALPRTRLERIFGVFAELADTPSGGRIRLHALDAARLASLEEVRTDWAGQSHLLAVAEELDAPLDPDSVTPPATLRTELRRYQRAGLAWLQRIRQHGAGGVLADDMGLGKTVQTLAHLLLEQAEGRLGHPALVVAPTSVLHNWESEIARFAPGLRVLVLQGPQRKRDFDRMGTVDVVITTYPLLARDRKPLSAIEYSVIVLDEAQHIKNASTQAARALADLRAGHRLCLTGTPLENHLGEVWSLFRFLLPGFLGDEAQFRRLYRTPIEKNGDAERRGQLALRLRPFLLRRTKEMVTPELPPKTEVIQRITLSGGQRDLYEAVRAVVDRELRASLERAGLAGSHVALLDALLKLRQTCCDPRLVRLAGARDIGESAKLDALMERLPSLIEEGRRVLVFSQFAGMIRLIAEAADAARIPHVILTGETADRRTPVERFQAGEVPVFLISLRAGGVGLNLTAADTVIHYDPWWNPAVERQATDRAHRIGQDKPVFVYKLIAAGSVEERILALQQRKASLAASILSGDALTGESLTLQDVDDLLGPLPPS
jgi:superfamily II DNA or RNA helicase